VASGSTVAAASSFLAHLLIALATAWHAPFPTEFDELQHLSVIRAQREAPSLFPDHRTERILRFRPCRLDGHAELHPAPAALLSGARAASPAPPRLRS
jgi:hypothetical protein